MKNFFKIIVLFITFLVINSCGLWNNIFGSNYPYGPYPENEENALEWIEYFAVWEVGIIAAEVDPIYKLQFFRDDKQQLTMDLLSYEEAGIFFVERYRVREDSGSSGEFFGRNETVWISFEILNDGVWDFGEMRTYTAPGYHIEDMVNHLSIRAIIDEEKR